MAQTRARMATTLGVLDREYALRHLFVRATRLARHPEGSARVVQDALRHDALPIAAITLGLGWLSFSRKPAGKELLDSNFRRDRGAAAHRYRSRVASAAITIIRLSSRVGSACDGQ